MGLARRTLGRTGAEVTILGLGGGVLRTFGYDKEAYALINRAIDLGINYFESARAYSGSESYYGRSLGQRRQEVFLTSKSHARDKEGALSHLHETLRNMSTDHLDLWQVHDVRTEDEVQEIFGPGGCIEAFVKAKEEGLARFIGVTGHHDPAVIRRCIEAFDFDTVLIPVNPAEPAYRSFIDGIMPLANEKGMGIVGMKVYMRGLAMRIPGVEGPEPFLRYALSQSVSVVTIGCDDMGQLEENVRYAETFSPLTDMEMEAIASAVLPYARQAMYYKP